VIVRDKEMGQYTQGRAPATVLLLGKVKISHCVYIGEKEEIHIKFLSKT
jgi:hypothetical protein